MIINNIVIIIKNLLLGVNGLESSTNHIIEMQQVLGIEAAR